MHHGTCVTHVPWCMSGSLTRGGGENVPGIPGACATHNFAYRVTTVTPLLKKKKAGINTVLHKVVDLFCCHLTSLYYQKWKYNPHCNLMTKTRVTHSDSWWIKAMFYDNAIQSAWQLPKAWVSRPSLTTMMMLASQDRNYWTNRHAIRHSKDGYRHQKSEGSFCGGWAVAGWLKLHNKPTCSYIKLNIQIVSDKDKI